MIIDVILDIKDDERDFATATELRSIYDYAMESQNEELARAVDSGTSKDIARELATYIKGENYKDELIPFVKSVDWTYGMDDGEEPQASKRANMKAANEPYAVETALGFPILYKTVENGRMYVIAKKPIGNDYEFVVGSGYSPTTGEWQAGDYGYINYEEALGALDAKLGTKVANIFRNKEERTMKKAVKGGMGTDKATITVWRRGGQIAMDVKAGDELEAAINGALEQISEPLDSMSFDDALMAIRDALQGRHEALLYVFDLYATVQESNHSNRGFILVEAEWDYNEEMKSMEETEASLMAAYGVRGNEKERGPEWEFDEVRQDYYNNKTKSYENDVPRYPWGEDPLMKEGNRLYNKHREEQRKKEKSGYGDAYWKEPNDVLQMAERYRNHMNSEDFNDMVKEAQEAPDFHTAVEIMNAYTNLGNHRFEDNGDIVGHGGIRPAKTPRGNDSKTKTEEYWGNRIVGKDPIEHRLDRDLVRKQIEKTTKRGGIKASPMLQPQYDSRKDFYNKARTEDKALYSYGSKVAYIGSDGQPKLIKGMWDYSATTLRHLKEWLLQNGFDATTKSNIGSQYEQVEAGIEKEGGKWVNRGKEGTHGKFDTREEALKQQRGMYANGFKKQGMYQKRYNSMEGKK